MSTVIGDISYVPGDTLPFQVVITADSVGDPPTGVDGWDAWFTAKARFSDADAAALVRISSVEADNRDGTVTRDFNALTNTVTLSWSVAPALTLALGANVNPFDIQVRDPIGSIETVQSGDLVGGQQVTISASSA